MKVAIIGAGVSGLVVAHLLHRRHEITVFEAADYAGGHTNTVRVDTADQTFDVDTGFIVFNDRNYPRFQRLLGQLGVKSQPSTMSFSVSDATGDFEYSSASPNGLFAKRAHLVTPWFHRMVAELAHFNRAARELLDQPGNDISLGAWLERERFSPAFVERLIGPQVSAVWSADPEQRGSFPARFLAEFFDNHGVLSFRGRPRWQTVSGGSARYVEALTRPFAHRLRLGTPVRAIARAARRRALNGARLRARALRRSGDRDALRSGAGDAVGRHRRRARDPRCDPLPAQRRRPAHGCEHAAAAPACVGELELPPPRASR